MKLETKSSTLNDLSMKEKNGILHFEGYAAIFGEEDRGEDIIKSGAFSKTLASQKNKSIKMLYQHDTWDPIGIWDHFEEDSRGLHVIGHVVDTTKGIDVAKLIKAQAVDGLSIGYITKESHDDNGKRIITELDLWEVSVVTFPMQMAAKIGEIKSSEELTKKLSQAGFSMAEARAIASGGFREAYGNIKSDDQMVVDITKATELMRN